MKHLPEDYKDNPFYRNFVDSDELLPCPFCGEAAESQEVSYTLGDTYGKGYINYNYGCSKCFSVRRFSKEEWNTRA